MKRLCILVLNILRWP